MLGRAITPVEQRLPTRNPYIISQQLEEGMSSSSNQSLKLTKLRESNKLATILACLIDPMNRLLNGELKVQPTRLGVDGSCLVLLGDVGGHYWNVEEL